jgi:hypothetical protein
MARGVTITPDGGSPVSLTPRPGSIKLAYDNKDVGGDGIPNVRQAAPMKCDFEVVVDSSSPTYTALLALRNATTKEADHAAVVTLLAAISAAVYTFADTSVQVSLDGDGVLIGKISIKGNVTVT